jgi:Ca2+-binding RTX toxin-like protein
LHFPPLGNLCKKSWKQAVVCANPASSQLALSGGINMVVKRGTLGADTLDGGSGKDLLFGSFGNDLLRGNLDDDKLYGQEGNDTLFGGAGNDNLTGGIGFDRLFGGDGDDYLQGAGTYTTGAAEDKTLDILDGGRGDDYITVGAKDLAIGGDGIDTLSITLTATNKIAHLDFSKIDSSSFVQFDKAGALKTVKVAQFEAVSLLGKAVAGSSVIGTAGDDYISLSRYVKGFALSEAPGLKINSGAGDDTIIGTEFRDTLNGGSGSDYLDGGTGPDTLVGGKGADVFVYQEFSLSPPDPVPQLDRILDFKPGEDVIVFSHTTGTKSPTTEYNFGDQKHLLLSGSNPVAKTAVGVAQFLFDTGTGVLSVDHDGKGPDAAVAIADFTNDVRIGVKDIVIDTNPFGLG